MTATSPAPGVSLCPSASSRSRIACSSANDTLQPRKRVVNVAIGLESVDVSARRWSVLERCGRRLLSMIGAEPGFPRASRRCSALAGRSCRRPDGEPNVFWRQWLAGRNLGLVPIDDPASFAWPGYWLATPSTARASATPC